MGLQRSKDSCQIFLEILQAVFSFQHGPCKHPCALICPNTPRANDPCALNCLNTPCADFSHDPCCFRQILAVALLKHGSVTRPVQQTRVR